MVQIRKADETYLNIQKLHDPRVMQGQNTLQDQYARGIQGTRFWLTLVFCKRVNGDICFLSRWLEGILSASIYGTCPTRNYRKRLIYHTLASNPLRFGPGHQSPETPDSQSHIDCGGLWHDPPGTSSCRRSPIPHRR